MKVSAAIPDTAKLTEKLEQTFTDFANLVSVFTTPQINEVPFAGSWTAGQVAQHIIKATAGIPDSQIKKTGRPYDEQVEKLKQLFLNMEIKMQAPDFIIPEEKLYDRNELLKELEVNKLYLTSIINCKPLDETCMDFEFPTFGFLTRYEWIQFILFHVQRHTIQLQNILSTHKK